MWAEFEGGIREYSLRGELLRELSAEKLASIGAVSYTHLTLPTKA